MMYKSLLTVKVMKFRDNETPEKIEQAMNDLFLKLEKDPKVQDYWVNVSHTQYLLIYDVFINVSP